jgi:hypothetical protein
MYLLGFCDDLYSNEFTLRPSSNYTCPMQEFNSWLAVQSNSDSPNATYLAQCGAATGLPVAPEIFDSCIVAWSRQVKELTILSRSDKVVAMYVPFLSRHQFDVPYDILKDEWHRIEDFIIQKRSQAPLGVHQFFWSSFTYWWYDTNGHMLQTAYSSVGIALLAAAAIILMSSRSFRLTLFSTITIAYVLLSVTATLVALGWHLGFLEGMYDRLQPFVNSTCRSLPLQSSKILSEPIFLLSSLSAICFAILVGVSVDFVIHFSHAYATQPGHVDRGLRARHALVQMGPSILAAAFTTIFSAVVMLFCVITFFQKFSLVLCFGIIQSTVGAFVFFITLVDCIGPCEPTQLVDNLLAQCPWVKANAKQLVSDADSTLEVNPDQLTTERSLSSRTSAHDAVAASIIRGESLRAGASSENDEDSIGDISVCSA